jgi:hypothetical protein
MNERQANRCEEILNKLKDIAMEFENVGLNGAAARTWELWNTLAQMDGVRILKG